MKTKRVTRYYADCGKGFWKAESCLNHEKRCKCWKNPKNKTCKTCVYGIYIDYDPETGDGDCYECNNGKNKSAFHTGAPKGIKYLSVDCYFYFKAS